MKRSVIWFSLLSFNEIKYDIYLINIQFVYLIYVILLGISANQWWYFRGIGIIEKWYQHSQCEKRTIGEWGCSITSASGGIKCSTWERNQRYGKHANCFFSIRYVSQCTKKMLCMTSVSSRKNQTENLELQKWQSYKLIYVQMRSLC